MTDKEGGHGHLLAVWCWCLFNAVNKISTCEDAVISNPTVCHVCAFHAAVFRWNEIICWSIGISSINMWAMKSIVMSLFCGKLIRYRLKFYVKCRQGLKKYVAVTVLVFCWLFLWWCGFYFFCTVLWCSELSHVPLQSVYMASTITYLDILIVLCIIYLLRWYFGMVRYGKNV